MVTQQKGFTLIELMIVVLLISIILGVAVPSYRGYTLRTGRTDAAIALLRVAAAQEKFYLQNGTYATNAQLSLDPPAGLGFTASKSERGYYALTVAPDAAGLAVGYTASAAPIAGEKQATDPDCTAFSIDQSGRRGANNGYVPAAIEKCWR